MTTLRVMFFSSVSSRTACSLLLICNARSTLRERPSWHCALYSDAITPPLPASSHYNTKFVKHHVATHTHCLSDCYTHTHARTHTYAHTHTHTRLKARFSGTTRVSRYQKGKTNLDFTGARDSEWQWHQLGHMQIGNSLQTDNHASTSLLSFLQAVCPSCRPTNSVKALKAHDQNTVWKI